MLVTKEEGEYIIKALLKTMLAFMLLTYVVINEYRHWELRQVNRAGDELFKQLVDTDIVLMKDLKVLKGIHIYEFEKINDEARSTLP